MEIDDYTLIKLIAKTPFGEVYLGLKKGSAKIYALKNIKTKYLKNPTKLHLLMIASHFKAFKYFENEISILKDVNHPNILKMIVVKQALEDVYIITEYFNEGTLEEYLEKYIKEKNKAFSEEIVQYIMKQVIDAIKYLHNKKIMHRDLNLSNILINYENENDRENWNIMKGKIKIIDFGFSRYLKKGELAKSILGSPFFMSPILLNKINKSEGYNDTEYDEKEDIWSLGIICYELLVGKNPFDSDRMNELLGKVNKGIYYIPATLSKEAISFLNCMIKSNPKQRLNIDNLYNHPFLNKNVKEFNKIDIDELKNKIIINNSKILIDSKNNEDF